MFVTVLLLAAVGLLIAALGTGHPVLAWGSVAMSVVAAGLVMRRWRRSWLQHQDELADPGSASAAEEVQPGSVSAEDAQPGQPAQAAETDPGE
jgi:membrane protein implicated in regulation of membrane protease activity